MDKAIMKKGRGEFHLFGAKIDKMQTVKRLILTMILGFGLLACAPQLNTKSQLVVLNGPADNYVSILADELSEDLSRYQSRANYNLISRSRAAFAETHNDMYGSRANASASRIANTFGAEFAVLISAPVFERTLKEHEEAQIINTKVQLEVRIVDPVTQETIANYGSSSYTRDRVEVLGKALNEINEDPDIRDLVDLALRQLSPQVAFDIESLFQRITPPVTQTE